jgi:hypothetical protein
MESPAAPARASARGRRGLRRTLAVIASTVLALALAEIAHRVWRAARGSAFDSAAALAEIRSAARAPAAGGTDGEGAAQGELVVTLHPYFGGEMSHDPHQVVESFAREPVSDTLRVFVFGGSVATFFAFDVREFAAERLAHEARLGGRAVELFCCAHDAYKQPQQLNKLAYLLARGIRPDLVIELDGFNELALARANAIDHTDPLYPTAGLWSIPAQSALFTHADYERIGAAWSLRNRARELAERAERWGLQRSSVATSWVLARLRTTNVAIDALEREQAHTPSLAPGSASWFQVHGYDAPAEVEDAIPLGLTAWEECSVSMAALCRARGIAYLHVLQPTLFDAGSKPLTPRERATADTFHPWRPPIVRHYAELRERGARLGERGVEFLDASRVFADVPDELYYDQCHFIAAGNERLWTFMEPRVVELLARARR